MPAEDKERPPNGAGWVVELRGYIFHQRQRDFVVGTLLANIAAKGKQAGAAPKPGEPPDPIGGKVSHPMLYRYKWVDNHQPGEFKLIDGSDLYLLVQGSSPGRVVDRAPAPGNPGSQVAASPSRREGWQPIPHRTAAEREAGKHLEGAQGAAKIVKGQFIRTEFIVLFIWREPTQDVVPK